MRTLIIASLAGKAMEIVDPGVYGPNFAASYDVYSGPTHISVSDPQTLYYHHNRLGTDYMGKGI